MKLGNFDKNGRRTYLGGSSTKSEQADDDNTFDLDELELPGLDPSFDVLSRLRSDFEAGRFPWIGSTNDFCLGYLTIASTLHARSNGVSKPVGSFVIGDTSTGKTQFIDALCELLPEDSVINLTTASSKALIYQCREDSHYLNGKVVFVEELSGLKNPEIQYLLRVLVTKGVASHTTVISGKAETIKIHGAISLQSTGLSSDGLRDDTMNRLVIFRSDSSENQTKAVIKNIKDRYTKRSVATDDDYTDYRDFFSSLKSYPVIVPYVDDIDFDTKDAISRRCSKIFMDLLATVALLNQARRETTSDGFLISEPEDFKLLRELTRETPKDPEYVLSPCQRAVFDAIKKVNNHADGFTYQNIEATEPLDPGGKPYALSSIKKAVGKLVTLKVVEIVSSGRPVVFKTKSQGGEGWFRLL